MIGLDRASCAVGLKVEVEQDTANWLLSRGYAVEVKESSAKKKTPSVKAVEDSPSIAEAKDAEISE